MSMKEAIRAAGGRVASMFGAEEQQPDTGKVDVVSEYAYLVRLASGAGQIDRQSGTWGAVSSWAAREILQARARLDSAKDADALAMRERIKTLKDLLSIQEKAARKKISVEGQAPEIP